MDSFPLDGQTQQWLLVRLEEPQAQAQVPAKSQ